MQYKDHGSLIIKSHYTKHYYVTQSQSTDGSETPRMHRLIYVLWNCKGKIGPIGASHVHFEKRILLTVPGVHNYKRPLSSKMIFIHQSYSKTGHHYDLHLIDIFL